MEERERAVDRFLTGAARRGLKALEVEEGR